MQFKIFGCKVNKYYTDEWLKSEYLKDKNGIFVASCVVTDKAKRKWIKFVKDEVKKLEGDDKIFISGCGAFKKGEAQDDFFDIYPELKEFEGKIVILGEKPEELKLEIDSKTKKEEKKKVDFSKLKNFTQKQIYTKKFLLIQGGCNSFCTFCLTVQKRGRHYYRDKDDIVSEITEFEFGGGKEVVLTGVNLSAWGLRDTNDVGQSRFAELLEYILEKTTIPRLRISSLGPEFIDDRCLEIFKNKRIYPHFHFSVQSGSSKVLKDMRRHYDGEYMRKLLEKTKNLEREDGVEVSIGADIIVGFPGETKDDFMDTYNLVKDGLITKVHAFPFSAHKFGESVPAGKFENQVSDLEKKDRMWDLEFIADSVRDDFIERNIGKKFEVLIEVVKEENGKIRWKGWTENYIEADDRTFEILEGEIKKNSIVKGILK
ncbi:radical SAM protein [Candidatus Gracilibacteria bacterium]|nr:MAG: radical SAM protein [Candidatus Gracilibacteria bacterium]